jgi:ABC-type transporter Mla subunit MlaD
VFLKKKVVILNNDTWRIFIDFNVTPYENVIATIRGGLLEIERSKQESAPVSELNSKETLLPTLETKLLAFKQILPRLEPRRGLFNFVGTILSEIFDTAAVCDVTLLHNTVNELQSNQKDIIHSVTDQFTYIRKLDSIASINADAIANLSGIVKHNMINSNNKLQQINMDLQWLNLTVHDLSVLFTTIWQLEFAVLHLTQQLDEFVNAIQHVIAGKLPMLD